MSVKSRYSIYLLFIIAAKNINIINNLPVDSSDTGVLINLITSSLGMSTFETIKSNIRMTTKINPIFTRG